MSKHDQRKPSTLEEFIEGANKETTAKKARKRPSKKDLLLCIAGRASNTSNYYAKASFFYMKKDLQKEIDKHCSGNKQGILNYLLRRGLDELIREGVFIVEDQE